MRVAGKKSWLLWTGIMVCFSSLACAEDLVINGDFLAPVTSGIPGWVTGTSHPGYHPVTYTAAGHDDPPGVIIGQEIHDAAGQYSVSWMSQNIDILPDALGATLTLYYRWGCAGPSSGFVHPYYIKGLLGEHTLFSRTGPDEPDPLQWEEIIYNLHQEPGTGLVVSRGQTLELYFEAKNDVSANTNYMFLDDVSLIVITTATKTATPTISPTITQTPTITKTLTITQTSTITPTYTISPTLMPTSTPLPLIIPAEEYEMVYPNPASGDRVKFMYSLSEPAHVFIDIYNLAGFRIARLEEKHQPAQSNLVTTWDIRDVAPGVYLYKISFETLDGRRRTGKIKKIVVAR